MSDFDRGVIPHEAEFLLYRTEDGRSRVEVRFDGETAWLTQAAMAALFQTNPQTITRHVGAIYAECEMEEGATCTSYVQVQTEGARRVRRHVRHYSLPRCRRRVVGELGEMVRIAAPAWECRDVRRRTEERLAQSTSSRSPRARMAGARTWCLS